MNDFTEVWAVPGKNSIIDAIDPHTGLTQVFGKDAATVLKTEPTAVRMTWDAWRAEAIARQQTPIRWSGTTKAKYWEMLEILPPALWVGGAFLVGEPCDHDFATGAPRYQAYWERGSDSMGFAYFAASRPMTRAELRAFVSGVAIFEIEP